MQVKVVSDRAFKVITEGSGETVDWDFTDSNYRCNECFDSMLATRESMRTQQHLLEQIVSLLDEPFPLHGKQSNAAIKQSENNYWISKTWIKNVRKMLTTVKKSSSTNSNTANSTGYFAQLLIKLQEDGKGSEEMMNNGIDSSEETVNSTLYCDEHMLQELAVDVVKKARLISQANWTKLLELLPNAICFPESKSPCKECSLKLSEDKQEISRGREQRALELQSHSLSQLNRAKTICCSTTPLTRSSYSVRYYAVDGAWMAYWRAYISDSSLPRPSPLTNKRLICDHGLALLNNTLQELGAGVDPANILPENMKLCDLESFGFNENGDYLAIDSSASYSVLQDLPPAELITEEQWQGLLKLYSKDADFVDVDVSEVKTQARLYPLALSLIINCID